jgi:NADH:ubiquinone oxidoreductase subunit 5 (subunit L)/multisubunit Na+/H+ antiporter MnhA subunit
LWKVWDVAFIDGIVNGTGKLLQWFGSLACKLQSGYARSYAAWIFAGTVILLLLILTR